MDKLHELDNVEALYNKESVAFKTDGNGGFAGLLVKDRNTGEGVLASYGIREYLK